ncbi:hypothetical protein L1D14_10830, partial [Vibrio tubiashii]|uniref:hypothetical protein n=1 Tax=Vibrio tubiashii TaxID=29498 RepID=UPI001EFC453E
VTTRHVSMELKVPSIKNKAIKLSAKAIAKTFGITLIDSQALILAAYGGKSWERFLNSDTPLVVFNENDWATTIAAALTIEQTERLIELLKSTSPTHTKPKSSGIYTIEVTTVPTPLNKKIIPYALSHFSESGEAIPNSLYQLSKPKMEELLELSKPIDREPYLSFIFSLLKWPIEIGSEQDWNGTGYCGSISENKEKRPIYIFNTAIIPGEPLSKFQKKLLSELEAISDSTQTLPILLFSRATSRSDNGNVFSVLGLQLTTSGWNWLFLSPLVPDQQLEFAIATGMSTFAQWQDRLPRELSVSKYSDGYRTTMDVIYHAVTLDKQFDLDNQIGINISMPNRIYWQSNWYTYCVGDR